MNLYRRRTIDLNERRLTPEILDELPHDAPEAVRSRRDIRLINMAMGNYRWIASQVRRLEVESGSDESLRWLELGAGDGTLARSLDRRLLTTANFGGVDFAPRPNIWPAAWQWSQADLFDVLAEPAGPWNAAIANLFLHHFDDRQLAAIGERLKDFDVLLFCEPSRRQMHRLQGFLAFPFVNRVTRHDMIVSVEAGFRDDELANALGLKSSEWDISVRTRFLGAYQFLAVRKKNRSRLHESESTPAI